MREVSWSLSHGTIRLTLLRHSIPLLDTLLVYLIMTMFTLNKCLTKYSHAELQLSKANSSDTVSPVLDLNFPYLMVQFPLKFMINGTIVNFPFLDGFVPRRTSYGVYISQLIRFARASSIVANFNWHNKALAVKVLKQGYRFNINFVGRYWPFKGGGPCAILSLFYADMSCSLFPCFWVLVSIVIAWGREGFLCASHVFVCLFCTHQFLSFFSSTWCQGWTAACNCGTPWTFLLTILIVSVHARYSKMQHPSLHLAPALAVFCFRMTKLNSPANVKK